MKPATYFVKKAITNKGNATRKYLGFLSIATIANTNTQMEIETTGISIIPFDMLNITSDKLPNMITPVKLNNELNLFFNKKNMPT